MHNKPLYDQLVSWFKTKTIQDSFVKAYERGAFPALTIPEELKDKAPFWWINEAMIGRQPNDWDESMPIMEKFLEDVNDKYPTYLKH